MVKVIFIDDNYLYQNFPLPKRLDRAALLSLIQLEQYTSIQDLLGTCLYEHIEDGVDQQTLTADEISLFKLIKYTLAMYSAKAAITLLRTQAANTKNEERIRDQYVIDALSTQIDSKVGYINQRIADFVKNTAAIKAIATADGCTGDLFNDLEVYNSSVYYPSTGLIDDNCEDL
jgi:phosphoenolpyruvate carboxylase